MNYKKIYILFLSVLILFTGCNIKEYDDVKKDFLDNGVIVEDFHEIKQIEEKNIPVVLKGKIESQFTNKIQYLNKDVKNLVYLKIKETHTINEEKKSLNTEYKSNIIKIGRYNLDINSNYVNAHLNPNKIDTKKEWEDYLDERYYPYIKKDKLIIDNIEYEYYVIDKRDIKGLLFYVSKGEMIKDEKHQVYLINNY